MTFGYYIRKHKEFDDYFKRGEKSNASNLPVIRYETARRIQAQLDLKESIEFVLKDTGEVIKVNVMVLILSYSRLRIYCYSSLYMVLKLRSIVELIKDASLNNMTIFRSNY